MAAARRMFLALAALLLPHSVSAAALQGIRARGAKGSASGSINLGCPPGQPCNCNCNCDKGGAAAAGGAGPMPGGMPPGMMPPPLPP
eukprot:CAMPEP_0177233416 /NCGR_PEP_ID=MMETSP0367-20130122/43854_1 /TAXON_ID=447022 ORGANISM="Scrippsiella hangoei-like, Strain SHHI-4" /NCGR_SAMPLE_ID=MMETSP0367 /ASSEMBLY_ACC=CAM_ASM_000362 /LENGTH=86 /DNA_ID=CAMNT_0018684147 /DNA_START=87 /DNA_END=343 /DNA_ORIENTATION=-